MHLKKGTQEKKHYFIIIMRHSIVHLPCGTTIMSNDELKFGHPLHLLVPLEHVQLHKLLFLESIATFFGKLCQPRVHGAENVIQIIFGNLKAFAFDLDKCPYIPFPKLEIFVRMGQMVVDHQWLQWHLMLHTKFVTLKRCGSNGSTQATTP
jgi:hypothetical protein